MAFSSPDCAANIHRIQRISDRFGRGLFARLRGLGANGRLAQWTSRNFAVRLPSDGVVDRRIHRACRHDYGRQTRRGSERRNFYGILRVTEREDNNGAFRELQHGRTRHGIQYLEAARKDWPTSYYGPHSGVAMALNALDKPNRRIAVVGLGAGTMAAWGRARRHISLLRNQSRCGADRADMVFVPERFEGANRSCIGRCARAIGAGIGLGPLPGFRLDRGGRVFKRFDTDASADGRVRRYLPAAFGSRRRARASHHQPRAQPGSGCARNGELSGMEGCSDHFQTTIRYRREQLALGSADGEPGFSERAGRTAISEWSSRAPIIWTDDFASLWQVLKFSTTAESTERDGEKRALW